MGGIVNDMLKVGQQVLPFQEFQQKLRAQLAQFYAESQQTAKGAAETATNLNITAANLAGLKAEMEQNEGVTAARFRHLEEESAKIRAQMSQLPALFQKISEQSALKKELGGAKAEIEGLRAQLMAQRGEITTIGKSPNVAGALEKSGKSSQWCMQWVP